MTGRYFLADAGRTTLAAGRGGSHERHPLFRGQVNQPVSVRQESAIDVARRRAPQQT